MSSGTIKGNKPWMNPTQLLGLTTSSRQFLKQRGFVTILPTCLALLVWNARTSRKKRFQLLHPDTPIAANIAQPVANNASQHKRRPVQARAHTFPKYKTGNQSLTLTVVPCKMRPVSNKYIRRWHFHPTKDTGYSDTIIINPGGNGPTHTINNRAELAAVLVAVQKAILKLLQTVPHPSFGLENSYWTQWLYSTTCTGNYLRTL